MRIGTGAIGTLAAIAVAVPGAVAGGGGETAKLPIGDGRGDVAKRLVGSFGEPMYVARAPGVASTIYVVERAGTVQAVVRGEAQAQPFLDISGLIFDYQTAGGEGGLLSIAFDPDYQANRLVYAYYVNADGEIEIDEFHAASDVDADESSRREVVTIPHPDEVDHYGGTIAFGRDGYLYAATGDGGDDTAGVNAQDRQSLLGKLLRIDPHGVGAGDYGIPPDNPFVARPARDEIYALGLRNPFRWSFDRGRIAIGDVGEHTWEEVDNERPRSLRGANFGWNLFEGDHRFAAGPKPPHYERPILEYKHFAGRHRAIVGGLVVRDPRLRSLYGRYLYADLNVGDLRSLIARPSGARDDRRLGPHVSAPVSFTEGPRHRIYVASLYGNVFRLVPG